MKRLLSLAIALLTVIFFNNDSSIAQVTITQADFSVIGDSIIEVNDTMPSAAILVGGTGSQTWDFSSLQAHSIDTTILIDRVTTPYASDFPSATMATETNGFFGFLNVGATDIFIEGFAGLLPPPIGITVAVPFMPTQQIMVFPDTVGSSFQDTSGFKLYFSGADIGFPIDSVGNLHTSYLTYSVDGYGMITTPAGTYNTIRDLTVEITIDSIVMKDPIFTGGVWTLVDPGLLGFPNPALDTTYTYAWLANGLGSQIAEVETDILGGTAISASYRLGNAFVALFDGDLSTKCKGECDGEAMPVIINGVTPLTYSWSTTPAQTNAMSTGLCSGSSYTVTITDASSATASATVNMVSPLNVLSLTASSVTPTCDTCMDGTATVSVIGGDAPYTYLWDDPGTQTTSTATGLNPGNYAAIVTDANGCVKTIVDTVNVGIREALAKPLSFKVYPNPTSGTLTISVNADVDFDFVHLYGAKGELLMTEEVSGSEHVIDISAYQDGLYLLKLVNKDIVLTRKVFLIR